MALEAIQRDGYIHFRASGRLTMDEWVPAESLDFPPGMRMLIDYTGVTSLEVELELFVQAAQVMAARQWKVAVVATLNVLFGVSRQTILTAGLPEGEQFAVFRDMDEAVSWLLAPPPLAQFS
jgi:hypothetical protein